MNDRDNNIATLGAVAIAMTGDSDGAIAFIEHCNNLSAKQKNAFPIKCNLSDEELKNLGFTFEDNIDKYLRSVILPENWKIERLQNSASMHNQLFDEENHVRAHIMMANNPWDRDAYATFYSRYYVSKNWDNNLVSVQIVDRKIGILRESEKVNLDFSLLESIRIENNDILSKKMIEYTSWLVEHFPEHENVLAYWSEK